MLKTPALAVALLAAVPALAGDDCLDLGRDTAYVITIGEHSTSCGNIPGVGFSNTKNDGSEDSIWFRVDGKNWVARDPASIAEANRLMAEVWELGEKQGALGAKQGRLGAEQGRLGAEQGRLGARQAIAALRDETIEDLSARMAELGERQAELGRRQSALGEQQSELGERVGRAIEQAQSRLSRLLEKAMSDGTAVRATRL
jgi:bla regulator protein blaR1